MAYTVIVYIVMAPRYPIDTKPLRGYLRCSIIIITTTNTVVIVIVTTAIIISIIVVVVVINAPTLSVANTISLARPRSAWQTLFR